MSEYHSPALPPASANVSLESIITDLEDISQYLQASEYELIQVMVSNGIWQGPAAGNPGGAGDLEWGLVPYLIHNPPSFITSYLSGSGWLPELANLVWKALEAIVPTQMNAANYTALIAAVKGSGIVADDGSLVGESTYEVLDEQWVWAVLDYALSMVSGDIIPFNTTPAAPITLAPAVSTDAVTIAIVGDWGTGAFTNGQAIEVMNQIAVLKPDYLIHLGDVYYAGTAGDWLPSQEEQNNFLNNLPAMLPNTCFTLNSNHEMYSGARGYFTTALADSRFSAQNANSYFALQYGGWTILGLDSAYYATKMYMNGSLDPNGAQAGWIQGLGVSADSVIVLTHHSPLNYDGTANANVPLWGQVNAALGGNDPAAWYWGHIHNGIVYNPTGIGHTTLARCLGHGALPFGNAWGLEGLSAIDYYAHTPNTANPPTVLNGFATLTIASTGEVTENVYEQGNPTPVYTNTYNLPTTG